MKVNEAKWRLVKVPPGGSRQMRNDELEDGSAPPFQTAAQERSPTINSQPSTMNWPLGLQYFNKRFLRYVHIPNGFHPLFAFFLFLEEFSFAGDVAAVAFGGHVFAEGADGFGCDNFATDGGLDLHGELLARDNFLELFGQGASPALGFGAMHDAGKGVHGLGVHEHVQLHHVALEVAGLFVIHGAVAARDAFDAVMEIDEDFVQRDERRQHDAPVVERFGVVHAAALFGNEGHHVADVFVRANHERLDHGFLDLFDEGDFGQEGGVIYVLTRAVGHGDFVNDAGIGRDDVHVVLATEPFLDNFHVQQAEETATEPEAEGDGRLRRVGKRGIVELQLGHGRLEMLVIRGIDGIDAAEHHRMDFLEAGQYGRRMAGVGDGIAHLNFLRGLDVGGEIAGLADFEFLTDVRLGIEAANFLDLDVLAGVEQFNLLAGFEFAIEDAHVGDDAFIGVKIGIEGERLEAPLPGRFGRRNARDNGFENVLNADALLGAGGNGQGRFDGQNVFELLERLRDVGVRQIDFVDDRDDGEVLFHRQVHVGDGLGLDALRGVNDEQRAFARAQAAGDFVGEVHVAGGINEIELVGLAVAGLIEHGDRVGLDGDAAFAL